MPAKRAHDQPQKIGQYHRFLLTHLVPFLNENAPEIGAFCIELLLGSALKNAALAVCQATGDDAHQINDLPDAQTNQRQNH